MEDDFCHMILDFEYTINKKELLVENIYVRHYNRDCEFKPKNQQAFSVALLSNLKEMLKGRYFQDLSEEEALNGLELIDALKNLATYQELIYQEEFDFQENITNLS